MPSLSRRAVLALVLVSGCCASVAACGVFGASGPEPAPAVTPADEAGPLADTGPQPEAAPPLERDAQSDALADALPPPPCLLPLQKTETLTSQSDGLIAAGSTQLFGGLDVCNTSVGRCLARFIPSQAAHDALAAGGKVIAMNLTLRRADTAPDCGGSCASATYRQDGTISVVPARTDWEEAQMTWFLAKTGSNWGTAGASQAGNDVGGLAGQLAVLATDLNPTIALDPAAWTATFLATNTLAVRYEVLTGVATRRQFVSVTHESGALPYEPPRLSITYCP